MKKERIKKIFLLLVFGLMISVFSSCSLPEEINFNKIAELEEQVVALEQEIEDMYSLFSDISLTIVKGNVMVKVKGITEVSQGSGVIFYEDDDYYYIITNNHVVYHNNPFARYEVLDYKMQSYEAKVLFKSPDYDLGVLRIQKKIDYELYVVQMADSNPDIGDLAVAIGQPEGQVNAITFGKVFGYNIPYCKDCDINRSNVQFECIYHDAQINRGNSGGMLLNKNKEIIGINTFGSIENSTGAAVPIEKIYEFLELNNFSMFIKKLPN